jgi:hypothetical protein
MCVVAHFIGIKGIVTLMNDSIIPRHHLITLTESINDTMRMCYDIVCVTCIVYCISCIVYRVSCVLLCVRSPTQALVYNILLGYWSLPSCRELNKYISGQLRTSHESIHTRSFTSKLQNFKTSKP